MRSSRGGCNVTVRGTQSSSSREATGQAASTEADGDDPSETPAVDSVTRADASGEVDCSQRMHEHAVSNTMLDKNACRSVRNVRGKEVQPRFAVLAIGAS